MKTFNILIKIFFSGIIAFSLISCESNEEDDGYEVMNETPEVNMSGRDGKMVNFENWDTDRNQEINEIEFNPGFENNQSFTNYDADKSSYLEKIEFEEGMHSTIDRNRDKNIDRPEFNRYASAWYGEALGSFEEWDNNNDNVITADEYNTITNERNLFSKWDKNKDNRIDKQEYSSGMFQFYDRDGNGRISLDEFNEADNILSDNNQ